MPIFWLAFGHLLLLRAVVVVVVVHNLIIIIPCVWWRALFTDASAATAICASHPYALEIGASSYLRITNLLGQHVIMGKELSLRWRASFFYIPCHNREKKSNPARVIYIFTATSQKIL
jgi:hypothetical protein